MGKSRKTQRFSFSRLGVDLGGVLAHDAAEPEETAG